MPGDNENVRNLSHHGVKAAQGFAARTMHDPNCVPCPEMPDGITGAPMNADPHGAGFKMPVGATPSAARPKDQPREMSPPHTMGPHDHLHPMPHQLTPRHTR
jgi:hypothetical protein